MSKAWKQAERQVASLIGGLRRSRGADWSESIEDVIHDKFAVEVKYGKQIPKYVQQDRLTVMLGDKSHYVVFTLEQDKRRSEGRFEYRKSIKFIEHGIRQAMRYDKTGTKIPLLAMKPKRYRGIIFCCRWVDYNDVLTCLVGV